MNILIVTGGNSSERKISLISAGMVAKALRRNGHRVKMFDFRKGYAELKKLVRDFDIIFPVIHGKEGEDGTLYGFLRAREMRFVGSDPKGARTASNKILFKKYCEKKRIPTAGWKIIKTGKDIVRFGFPCVLKAATGGSSHEVALLYSARDLANPKVKKILKLHDTFFVERLIDGTEITMGIVLGKAYPVVEIVPPKGSLFNYQNKYSGRSKEIPFAPSVNKSVQKKAQQIALRIHQDLKLGSYSRTDAMVKDGKIYILETNTPGGVGLTPHSLLPKSAKAIGISFEQLVEQMLK
ncbi:MAG TPA: hypothetical protein VMA75_03895 [Candidatus Paceibacterota bacterium]|nr:hypothetical protein [Candidatus Paceibacterota bacterium]